MHINEKERFRSLERDWGDWETRENRRLGRMGDWENKNYLKH